MSVNSTLKSRQVFSGKNLSLLAPVFRRYRLRLILGFTALLGVDSFQLLTPRFIKRAVDALETGKASNALLLQCAGYILLLALGIACCRFLWRYLIIGFSRLLERDLRDRLVAHLLTLDSLFFQRHTTGELMALSSNDLAAVQLAAGMGLIASVDAMVMTLAALGFMAYINPTLTVIAVAPMPILAFSARFLSARLHRRFKRVQEQFASMTEFVRSTLSSVHLLKAYTQEQFQAEQFDRMGKDYIRHNLRLSVIQGLLFPFSGFIGNCSLLLVLFFGGRLTVQGTITVGDFVAFVSYLFMLTWPMTAIGWVTNLFQRGATSLSRIKHILEQEPELHDAVSSESFTVNSGTIRLNRLSFTYAGQADPALEDVNVVFKKGLVGVIGKTGSGKTTLCHILTRLYPVDEGVFFLDERDVNTLSLATVRATIAYVPQETTIFSETIQANIALGKMDASMEEIERVAKAASIHDEILAFGDGYQSRVGEKGVKLSGGQRQRIALARALLLDRPIVIIDDGLSAVDTETEHAILQQISSYLQGKTCIVISHRIAPLAEADEILVMDKGKIVARGDHQTLLAGNTFYATIYAHQTDSRARKG
ncbi:MAG: ABC transporter ATP-binding protein/permease [Desulfobulbaceae bacterium]|nr:ABC transporter ATP-binding protein/permease [Desulfobulbaceae bacterium]